MKNVTPIIVVGMNRTGTKWVSNILCNHPKVIGIQSDRSRGILETNMYGTMQDKFDLAYPDEYVGLIELWSETEFFNRANGNKEMFYKLSPRPRNVLRMFEILLQDFASENQKSYWVQKTSPSHAITVLKYFANAHVVVTRRGLLNTLKSTWVMQLRYGTRRLIRSTYQYVKQEKLLNKISKKFNAVEVVYEKLIEAPENEVAALYSRLGLDTEHVNIEIPFKKNTSFADDRDRTNFMSKRERYWVICLAAFFRLIPLGVMSTMATVKEKIADRQPRHLVAGSFGPLVDQLTDRSTDKK